MNIVYQGKTNKGLDILIRYPQIGDDKLMCEYINNLSREKTFVRFQGEEVLLKDETNYLNSQLQKIEVKEAVMLLVFQDEKLIAIAGINMTDKTAKHIGMLAISVAKDFRGTGVGKVLMEMLLKETKKQIADLKIVTLEVYEKNAVAQNLYQKTGFVEYGRLPNGIMRDGRFEDGIFMYKNIS